MFWVSTGEIIIQLLLYSLFVVSLPISFIALGIEMRFADPATLAPIASKLSIEALILLGLDYVSTIIAAVYLRKFSLLFFGMGFFIFLLIDSFIYLATLPLTFRTHTSGIWVSPKRQAAI